MVGRSLGDGCENPDGEREAPQPAEGQALDKWLKVTGAHVRYYGPPGLHSPWEIKSWLSGNCSFGATPLGNFFHSHG
ncbi:hypothetical protein I79_023126 [Cricetulus griseus]|uniref:Uncharacterized protein n=1 Tax=Cricetulus griseus TaxID=10029 RepID=G3IH45_CRIGR|nr:hypothetical protein I79_023126 [Cricetulus griseus]